MLPTLLIAPLFATATVLLLRRIGGSAEAWPGRALLLFSWAIVVAAGALSVWHRLGDERAWIIAGVVYVAAAAAFFRILPKASHTRATSARPARNERCRHPRSNAVMVVALALAALVAIVSNLALLLGAAPGSWDGLAYHLPRMALAIQHGSFDIGATNFWAQEAHPVCSTALLVFGSVAAGHSEHALGMWQFVAWIVAAAGVWSLTRELGASSSEAWFAALVFLVLPQSIVQAAAVGNDMILAALTAAAAYELFMYVRDARLEHLAWLTLAVGLGLGMKLSFVCQAVMLGALAWALARRMSRGARIKLLSAFAAAVLLAAPTGYARNLHTWGSLVGPPDAVRTHTFSGQPPSARAANSLRNLVRLSTDFVSLDGMPRVAPLLRIQSALRRAVMWPWRSERLGITGDTGARMTFIADRPALAHEAHSYWGILGLMLVWPAVLGALIAGPWERRVLACCVILFLILQACSGPYDSFRGRYFLSAAVLACPLAADWLRARSRAGRVWLLTAVAAGTVTALSAGLFRTGAPLVTVRYGGRTYHSILTLDRAAQLARNRQEYADAFRAYERIVPRDASVLARLPPDSFEYPLFGAGLERRVTPAAGRPLNDAADYVVFSSAIDVPQTGDAHLGADWWLRRATAAARAAR